MAQRVLFRFYVLLAIGVLAIALWYSRRLPDVMRSRATVPDPSSVAFEAREDFLPFPFERDQSPVFVAESESAGILAFAQGNGVLVTKQNLATLNFDFRRRVIGPARLETLLEALLELPPSDGPITVTMQGRDGRREARRLGSEALARTLEAVLSGVEAQTYTPRVLLIHATAVEATAEEAKSAKPWPLAGLDLAKILATQPYHCEDRDTCRSLAKLLRNPTIYRSRELTVRLRAAVAP
ncbi:MAG: hypothetical protein KDB53_13660 [Planctomycetes bacterium]|nr:hypothetical protein [Planctomycetota bacterium]